MCQEHYHLAIGSVLNYSLFSDLLADYWNYIEFQGRLLEPASLSGLLSLPSVKSLHWPAHAAGAKATGKVLLAGCLAWWLSVRVIHQKSCALNPKAARAS